MNCKIETLLLWLFLATLPIQTYAQVVDDGPDYPRSSVASSLTSSTDLYFNLVRAEPVVIRRGVDTFTLMIGAQDDSIESIEIEFRRLAWEGILGTQILLKDDGTQGDLIAGDRIFTVDQLSVDNGALTNLTLALKLLTFTLNFADGSTATMNGRDEKLQVPGQVHSFDPALVPIPVVQQLGDDIYATNYVVNLVMTPEGSYPFQYFDFRNRYYEIFPDDIDFIVNDDLIRYYSSGGARYNSISNSVQGIGRSISGVSSNWTLDKS